MTAKQYITEARNMAEKRKQIEQRAKMNKRPLTTEERAQVTEYELREEINTLRAQALIDSAGREGSTQKGEAFNQYMREDGGNARARYELKRSTLTTEDAAGAIGLTIEDVLNPIESGLIYSLAGMEIPTGLAPGAHSWPYVSPTEVVVAGEGVDTDPIKLELSGASVIPDAINVGVTVDRAIVNYGKSWEQVIQKALPTAARKAINALLFTPATRYSADILHTNSPFGLDADGNANYGHTAGLSSTPTIAELNTMKAALLAEGLTSETLIWAMSNELASTLEITPIGIDGINGAILENNKILGIPVYRTDEMSGFVGLGDWRYAPAGIWGDPVITVNPYSEARRDALEFWLHIDFAAGVATPKAFSLGTCGV